MPASQRETPLTFNTRGETISLMSLNANLKMKFVLLKLILKLTSESPLIINKFKNAYKLLQLCRKANQNFISIMRTNK
jgi:hypothetical protein